MRLKFLFFIFLLMLSSVVFAQREIRCLSSQYLNAQIKKNPEIALKKQEMQARIKYEMSKRGFNKTALPEVLVPVVVHVLYNTSVQNISDAQIKSQIDVLNEDFGRKNADASAVPSVWKDLAGASRIQFTLAKRDPQGVATTGIIRKKTSKTYFDVDSDDEKFSSRGGDDIWDRNLYLNIWVVPKIQNSNNDVVLGYGQHPYGAAATDGVTIGYRYFGRTGTLSPTYNKGRTATHEVGHWFDLQHIWGDDAGGCDGSDAIDDTPNQASDNSGIPTFPETDACTTEYPGIMFMNYMDYTDDGGMNMFTVDQVAKMEMVVDIYRSGLKTSPGATVSINDISVSEKIKVYPNPFNSVLNIEVPKATGFTRVSIFDVIGNCIVNTSFNSVDGEKAFVDLSDHASGCYFVRINSGNQQFVKKVMLVKE